MSAHACPTHLPDVPPRTFSCYAEADVLPGLNVSELARRYEADPLVASNRNRRNRLRDPRLAGWFYQQFLKMAFPLAAPLTVATSVSGMINVMAGLTPSQNGKFMQYDGSELPW